MTMYLHNIPHSTQKLPNFSILPPKPKNPNGFFFPTAFSPLISPSLSSKNNTRCFAQAAEEEKKIKSKESLSKLVLVIGGTGGVGQLVVASLLSRNIKSRLLLRNPQKAVSLFGQQDESNLQVWKGDIREPNDLDPTMFDGVTHVICCTGTTAFPSTRWEGDNTPQRVDCEGIQNLVAAMPRSLERVIFVSSIGVTKCNELPWRAGRLTDGPYTSYDVNTLLKATAGERRAVIIGQGDKLAGEASRIVVAEACIQALDINCTKGQIYEIISIKGDGPGCDPDKWSNLFGDATKILV